MNLKGIVRDLISKKTPFVLYRKPQGDSVKLIVDADAKSVNLKDFSFDQKGFVFFPFDSEQESGVYFSDEVCYDLSSDDIELSTIELNDQEQSLSAVPVLTSEEKYVSSVSKALENIENDTFKKVVLSKVKKDRVKDKSELAEQLFSTYSKAFTYFSYTHQFGMWLGATPETLLCQNGDEIKTVALAGTQSAVGKDEKEAQWTQKEIEEQALVCRYIINCFKKIRLREFEDVGPKTVKAGELFHLKTEFFINEKEIGYTDLFGQLVRLLHPTSAVCGMSLETSKVFIEENENHQRELFTGICGPINIDDNSHLFVNLRSAKIIDDFIYAFAGAGITIDSDPSKEWIETELKCDTILSLLNKK